MDPMTMLAISGALGAAKGGGGGAKTTQSSQQTTNLASNSAQNTSLAFNPVLAAMTGGGGFAPQTSGNLSGGLTQTPTTTSNPTTSNSLSEGAGSVLPRFSPTGYSYGPGFGLYPSPYQPTSSFLGNDIFFLFVIAGAVFWFAFQE